VFYASLKKGMLPSNWDEKNKVLIVENISYSADHAQYLKHLSIFNFKRAKFEFDEKDNLASISAGEEIGARVQIEEAFDKTLKGTPGTSVKVFSVLPENYKYVGDPITLTGLNKKTSSVYLFAKARQLALKNGFDLIHVRDSMIFESDSDNSTFAFNAGISGILSAVGLNGLIGPGYSNLKGSYRTLVGQTWRLCVLDPTVPEPASVPAPVPAPEPCPDCPKCCEPIRLADRVYWDIRDWKIGPSQAAAIDKLVMQVIEQETCIIQKDWGIIIGGSASIPWTRKKNLDLSWLRGTSAQAQVVDTLNKKGKGHLAHRVRVMAHGEYMLYTDQLPEHEKRQGEKPENTNNQCVELFLAPVANTVAQANPK
jgi:hypothetical protein